jgi:hypothetical protein
MALRRHGDQISWTELRCRVSGMDHNPTLQTQQGSVPRTLVLTHHPARGKSHQRLPERGTSPAVTELRPLSADTAFPSWSAANSFIDATSINRSSQTPARAGGSTLGGVSALGGPLTLE